MAYVITNGSYYCQINKKNGILKTQDINLAAKYASRSDAQNLLDRATKKLKGYEVFYIDGEVTTGSIKKTLSKRIVFSQTKRNIIYNKNKGRCAICGQFIPYNEFTVDHIIPLAKGGTNSEENLQCACKVCNLIKQDILPQDLMEKLTQIVLYQMEINYDDSLRKSLNYIRSRVQRVKFTGILKLFSN